MLVEKTYRTECDRNIQEIIRVTMSHNVTRNIITKKEILKIIFSAKEMLTEQNPYKQSLAFYWYRDGPYSEVIEDNLQMLVDEKKIIRSKTNQRETYRLAPEHNERPIVQLYDDFIREIVDAVQHVKNKFTDVHDIVQHIYKTAAPTPWYVSYKLEFMPKFESHCKDIKENRKSLYTPEQLLDLFDDAVLDVPMDPKFIGIRLVFMDYSKILNAFLRWDEYTSHIDLLDELLEICHNIWNVFAYGMRAYNHDDYYEPHADEWRHKYEEEVRALDRIVIERVKKYDGIVVDDDLHIPPDVEDMILHPERHAFKPLEATFFADNKR